MMKKSISIQSTILIFAMFIATTITLYVGSLGAFNSSFYWNTLLVNTTFMGDAFFAFAVVFFLLFFFKKKSYALKLLIAIFISLTITQIIKNIFSGIPVQIYFEGGIMQNQDDVFINKNVISSHVAIAFTLASFFWQHSKSKILKISVIALAIFVGITRISLGGETLLALAIGIFPATISTLYLFKLMHRKESTKHRAYYYKSRKGRNVVQQLMGV